MTRGLIALHIDFQERRETGQPRLGWLVLVLGALLLAGACAEYAVVDAELSEAHTRAEQSRHAAKRGAGAVAAEARETADALRAANLVRQQLAAPWGRLFVEVESAAHEDIPLLSLHADPAARALRVSGEARNFTALMAYVRRLEASPVLADVRLAGHEVRQHDPRRPVAFSLSASWGATP